MDQPIGSKKRWSTQLEGDVVHGPANRKQGGEGSTQLKGGMIHGPANRKQEGMMYPIGRKYGPWTSPVAQRAGLSPRDQLQSRPVDAQRSTPRNKSETIPWFQCAKATSQSHHSDV